MHYRKIQLKKYEEENREEVAASSNQAEVPNKVEQTHTLPTLRTDKTVAPLNPLERSHASEANPTLGEAIEPVAERCEANPTPGEAIEPVAQRCEAKPTPGEAIEPVAQRCEAELTPGEAIEPVASTSQNIGKMQPKKNEIENSVQHFRKMHLKRYEQENREEVAASSNQTEVPNKVEQVRSLPALSVAPLKPFARSRAMARLNYKTMNQGSVKKIKIINRKWMLDVPQNIEPVAQRCEAKPTPGKPIKPVAQRCEAQPTPGKPIEPVASTSQNIVITPRAKPVAAPTPSNGTRSTPTEILKPVVSTSQNIYPPLLPVVTIEPTELSSYYIFPPIPEPMASTSQNTAFTPPPALTIQIYKKKELTDTFKQRYPYTSPINPNQVIIGPNNTTIDTKNLVYFDWTGQTCRIVRQLCMCIFGHAILSTHNLTGTPTCPNLMQYYTARSEKKVLNPDIVSDIVFFMKTKYGCSERDVRLNITYKCEDEFSRRKYHGRKLSQAFNGLRINPF